MIIDLIFWVPAFFLSVVTARLVLNTKGAKASYEMYKTKIAESVHEAYKDENILLAKLFKRDIFHDFLLNFLGTLIGWACVYYICFYRLNDLVSNLEIIDLVILTVAFIGITGYLPHVVINKGFKL